MKVLKRALNFKEIFLLILNRFLSVRINNVIIPKRNSGLIHAHIKLQNYPIRYRIQGDYLLLNYDQYTITTSVYDESFCMTIEESILKDEYCFEQMDLKQKRILDIGANIGDTAIKCIVHGAKSVVALEPIPSTFQFLELNILNNNLTKKIKAYSYGIGAISGTTTVPIRAHASGGNSVSYKDINRSKKQYNTNVEINLIDLESLKNLLGEDFDIIKVDCEGCEYELIKTSELITYFDPKIILIEYHEGFVTIADWIKRFPEYEITWLEEKTEKLGLARLTKKDFISNRNN